PRPRRQRAAARAQAPRRAASKPQRRGAPRAPETRARQASLRPRSECTSSRSGDREDGLEPDASTDSLRLGRELCALRLRQPARRADRQLDALAARLALPDPGADAVDEKEADARGPFVAAAAVIRDLLAHRVGNELLALAEAHD